MCVGVYTDVCGCVHWCMWVCTLMYVGVYTDVYVGVYTDVYGCVH